MFSPSLDKGLLRVTKDFTSEFEDELSVRTGDLMQFLKKVDRFWYEVYFDSKTGKVPISHCRELNSTELECLRLIDSQSGQAAFVARHDFCSGCQEGDLRFSKSELIIGRDQGFGALTALTVLFLGTGFKAVNDDWWHGARLTSVRRNNQHLTVDSSQCGIFPLTYVWQLRDDLIPEYVFNGTGVLAVSFQTKPAGDHRSPPATRTTTIPKVEITAPTATNSESSYLFYVKVAKTMSAQLPSEIDLPREGEILAVASVPDKMYYHGHSFERNIDGIFPKNFVKVIDQKEADAYLDGMAHESSNNSSESSLAESPIPPSISPPPPPATIPGESSIVLDFHH